jgi:excisionase family DNA binding protein
MSNNLLNVDEFAEELGVTIACIRRWVLERRISTVKVGRRVKIPRSEAERIIEVGFRPATRPLGRRVR